MPTRIHTFPECRVTVYDDGSRHATATVMIIIQREEFNWREFYALKIYAERDAKCFREKVEIICYLLCSTRMKILCGILILYEKFSKLKKKKLKNDSKTAAIRLFVFFIEKSVEFLFLSQVNRTETG